MPRVEADRLHNIVILQEFIKRIKRVPSIGEGAIIEDILGHGPPFASCTVIEEGLLGMVD